MAPAIKKYFVSEVAPGMVLAKDILSARGMVMLSANTVLTESMIERIICWGFTTVDIIQNSADDAQTLQKRAAFRRNFIQKYVGAVQDVKQAFEEARQTKHLNIDQLREVSYEVVDSLAEIRGVINYLHTLRSVDEYTFQHSVNVAVFSGVFGKWLGLSKAKLKDLVFTGLLHDVGKTQIPLKILNKPGKLTTGEMDTMKCHSTIGYEMIKKAGVTSPCILTGVWQHHERSDGSGYPLNLMSDKITMEAKVIAIADIYDAMTSDKVYRQSVTPFTVMETLCSEMFAKLDPTICTVILNYLQDFFIGNIVLLNDGREAEVIYVDKAREIRPVVRTVDGEYINLEKSRQITIVEVLSN